MQFEWYRGLARLKQLRRALFIPRLISRNLLRFQRVTRLRNRASPARQRKGDQNERKQSES